MNPALAELRDIHLPAIAPWWELAPGWWLLLALSVVAIIWMVPKLRKWYRSRTAQKALKHEIAEGLLALDTIHESGETSRLLSELSVLLRRVAVTLFPAEQIEGLTGKAWLSFLDQQWSVSQEQHFSSPELAELLLHGPYRKATASDKESVAKLMVLSKQWLDVVVKNHV